MLIRSTRKKLAGTAMLAVSGAASAQTLPPTSKMDTTVSIEALPTTSNRAQSGASQSDTATGDIVITAQRREQRLQDVPISVSVTTGESIAKTGIRDLGDLAKITPGVKLATNTLSDQLNIRGVGSGVNAGFEQSVGTFVDGVYRGRSRASRASLFDVERVEVLKGPQTTFFGNNTIGGLSSNGTENLHKGAVPGEGGMAPYGERQTLVGC